MRRRTVLVAALLTCACDDEPSVVGPDAHATPQRSGATMSGRGGIDGSGNVVTESRSVGAFRGISLTGIGRLEIAQTGTDSVTVTADDNLLPVLVSKVVDGALVLGVARDVNIGRVHEITFHVTVDQLRELEASGAASVVAAGIDTDELVVRLNGATTAKVSGRAGEQFVSVAGASTYDGGGVESRNVVADATGASRIVVRVRDNLRARVRGAGLITYIGDPIVTVDGPPNSVRPQ